MKDIILRNMMEKEFLLAQKEMLQDSNSYDFVAFNSLENCQGIEYHGKIIGFYKLKKYIKGNISIELALIPEYRNKNLAKTINNLLLETYGNQYPNSEYFLILINYKNTKALKSIEKTDWERIYDFDEIMYNEDGEQFLIFGKKNPNYIKKTSRI